LYRQDGLERVRITLLICQFALSLLAVVIACALVIGIVDFFDYDWYENMYLMSSGFTHPLAQGWGFDLNGDLVSELTQELVQIDESITLTRLYRSWHNYYASGTIGEFSGTQLAQADPASVNEIGLVDLKLDDDLLEADSLRVLVSQLFAETLFGHQDVIGTNVNLSLNQADFGYDSFIICGTYAAYQGSQRYLDIGSEIVLLDPINYQDFRELGDLIVKTTADPETIVNITNQFLKRIDPNIRDVSVQSYQDFLQSRVILFNVFSGSIVLTFLAGLAVILLIIGVIIVLSGKIAEGHFNIGLHYVLGVPPTTIKKSIFLWLLPLFTVSLVISFVIALFLLPVIVAGVVVATPELVGMQSSWLWLLKSTIIVGASMLVIVYLITRYATFKITGIEPVEAVKNRI